MKDMIDIITAAMSKNETIAEECADRIKPYIYPETADTSKPFITICPLNPPVAAFYASDKNLSYEFFYQIDVQSLDRKKCKLVQSEVKKVMEELGFTQQSNGLDEFFKDTKRYVDARRYLTQTNLYDTDY